jgi:hypothetical protein
MATEKGPSTEPVDRALDALATSLEEGFRQAQAQQQQMAAEGDATTARGVVTLLSVLVDPTDGEED